MPGDLTFACRCGKVAGRIADASPASGDQVVCHCHDCQHFARRFDAADRVMDGHGGTALFQSRCARVQFESGREEMACLHLTEKPTLRWYAACCETPMFNTYANGKVPYITTLLGNCDAGTVRERLGAPIGHLFTADAPVHPGDVPEMSMMKLMRRFFGRMVRDIVSGDRRRAALFDARTLRPIASPERLGV